MFVLRLFKMVAKQTEYSRLEQMSVIKFFVAKKWKPYKIYKRMCDVYEEACFSKKKKKKKKKKFINGINITFPLHTWAKTSLLEHKDLSSLLISLKKAQVNSASYFQIFKKRYLIYWMIFVYQNIDSIIICLCLLIIKYWLPTSILFILNFILYSYLLMKITHIVLFEAFQ